jgi:hypothetical protein
MAMKIENSFTQYELTLEEHAAAVAVSPLTLMYFQNLLAERALKRLELRVDTNEPTASWIAEEAYLAGQLDLLMLIREDLTPPAVAETNEE